MQGADAASTVPSAADDAERGRPVRLALVVAAAWLGTVVLARLLLAGGAGWALFALLVPLLLVGLGRRLGLFPALLLVALFAAATLALRAVLATPRLGWGLLLLAPVAGLSAWVALRVVAGLRSSRRAKEQ